MVKKLLFIVFPFLAFAQSSTAIYNINLSTIWTSAEHTSVPGSAHWSDLIGATHNTANEFMQLGQLATTGIKNVAEFGSNTAFTSEINAAITNNKADQKLQDGFATSAGNNSQAGFSNITVSDAYPLITLVSMVAPSPDWFIAVNSLNLRSGNAGVNNGWKSTFTVDVFVYDAGTDSGTNYTSGNQPTIPFQNISMASGAPTNGNRMATITFTYVSSALSITDFEDRNAVQLHPNPVSGEQMTLTNAQSLKSVLIYDSLGKLVKDTSITESFESEHKIDIAALSNGIYLVRLFDNEDRITTKRLVINR